MEYIKLIFDWEEIISSKQATIMSFDLLMRHDENTYVRDRGKS